MKEFDRKSAVSFCFQHGIFLKNEDREAMNISIDEPALVAFVKEDFYGYEVCKDFTEINPKKETKMLLSLFEELIGYHFQFLVQQGLTKTTQSTITAAPLFDLYPELRVKHSNPFAYLYRKVEDALIDLIDEYPNPSKSTRIKSTLQNEVEELTRTLLPSLSNYYEEADCAVGIGSFISSQMCQKPIEFTFGIGEMDFGNRSRIQKGEVITANPFLLEWVIDEISQLKRKELVWRSVETKIENPSQERIPVVPMKKLKARCYVPSKELLENGIDEVSMEIALRNFLIDSKPFAVNFDFLLPFVCPSIVLEVQGPEDQKNEQSKRFTLYGSIPQAPDVIYQINDETKIEVDFFKFPRFNKRCPVVLDTGSIDISRLPLSNPAGSFFEAYLEGRVLIIPLAVLYELKTRLRSPDGAKVQKALSRLNNLLTWGLLKR